MQDATSSPQTPVFQLRAGGVDELWRLLDCTTDDDLAVLLRFNRGQISRIRRRKCDISPGFIARVVAALAERHIDEVNLFEIAWPDGSRRPIAIKSDRAFSPDVELKAS